MSQIPILIPTTLLLTALVSLLAGLRSRKAGYGVAVAGAGIVFALALVGVRFVITSGEAIRYAAGSWAPPIGIELVLDHLSAYLAVLITFIGLLVLVYTPRSLRFEAPGKEVFAYPAMVLLLAGLTGMVLTGDVFNLYVFLEISALAAYALLAIGERGAPIAAFRYLLMGAVGGGFYLLGVGMLYFAAGTLNMADLHARLPELVESRAVISAAVLMVTGLGLKMALFPLHFWLPDVYANAPSSVAGLIAPIMTKVSAYAIIRIFLDVFPPGFFTESVPLTATVGWFSAGGIIFGSVMAIAQQDYRRMLAYSSVGQVAYVGLGIGLANPIGLIGGLLHILNHALMKCLLFLVGGAVRLRTGVVQIPDMKGLGRSMPWTMGAFTVGALAMVGIPPAAGFFSKWYLLLGTIEAGNWWWFGIVVLSSLLSAVYFFRVLEIIYRDPTSDPAEADGNPAAAVVHPEGEPPPTMLGPILVLAVAILVAGVLNVLIVNALLERAVAPLGG
ncbi:MAG: monovalent cation/H+ antiporter subunit D family protein [Gemmatimonadota bacterium]